MSRKNLLKIIGMGVGGIGIIIGAHFGYLKGLQEIEKYYARNSRKNRESERP